MRYRDSAALDCETCVLRETPRPLPWRPLRASTLPIRAAQ